VPLTLERKKAIVTEVKGHGQASVALVTAEYRGLTVSQITDLRVKARAMGVKLRVVRNTLARLAFQGTPYEALSDSLVGPIILAFALEEPSAPARLFQGFMKENEQLKVKALFLDGRLFEGSQLGVIAKLPTRQEAYGRLVTVLQAPITKFVRTLAAPPTKLVRLLVAIREQKR